MTTEQAETMLHDTMIALDDATMLGLRQIVSFTRESENPLWAAEAEAIRAIAHEVVLTRRSIAEDTNDLPSCDTDRQAPPETGDAPTRLPALLAIAIITALFMIVGRDDLRLLWDMARSWVAR